MARDPSTRDSNNQRVFQNLYLDGYTQRYRLKARIWQGTPTYNVNVGVAENFHVNVFC